MSEVVLLALSSAATLRVRRHSLSGLLTPHKEGSKVSSEKPTSGLGFSKEKWKDTCRDGSLRASYCGCCCFSTDRYGPGVEEWERELVENPLCLRELYMVSWCVRSCREGT